MCSNCKGYYHYGDCSGQKEYNFRKLSNEKKRSWICSGCKKGVTSPNTDQLTESIAQQLKPIIKQLLEEQLSGLKLQLEEYKTSVEYCSDKIDDAIVKFDDLSTKCKENGDIVGQIKDENIYLRKEMADMKYQLEVQAQYSRCRNIIFDGLPVFQQENLRLDFIGRLSRAISIPINEKTDIQDIHRLPSRRERPQPIIAVFFHRSLRDQVVAAVRKLKLDTNALYPSIKDKVPLYASDHLTPYFRNILLEAKNLKKNNALFAAWFNNNKVYVKSTESSNAVVVKRVSELSKLVNSVGARDESNPGDSHECADDHNMSM